MNDCGNPDCTNPDCPGLAGGGCPDLLHNVRDVDPPTSHKAAAINQRSRNGLRFNMLLTHGELAKKNLDQYNGFTNDEIAVYMNLPVPPNGGSNKMCYWKRHSELATDFGFLMVQRDPFGRPVERRIPGGELQQVLWLTARGLLHLDEMLASFPHGEEKWPHW